MRSDDQFMRMALRLARRGTRRGRSHELRSGAVVVAGDLVVGRSDRRTGCAVASALSEAGKKARGATVYTNIDPCCDASDPTGCFRDILRSRPARVVIGCTLATLFSPYSGHARRRQPRSGSKRQSTGELLATLMKGGIAAETGVLEQQCLELNEAYAKYSATGLPYVTVKYAQSLDGRIATATGQSQWISGDASLRFAHMLRRENDAVLVGIGTVLADDPRLTVRLVDGLDPLRVVVDSRLRVPITSRVLSAGAAPRTLIATSDSADPARARELESMGTEILRLPSGAGSSGLDLGVLLAALGRRSVTSVLVEGGAGIITSLLADRRVDRLVVAVAPKIIGLGRDAVGDLGTKTLSDAITFSSVRMRKLGQDVVFDARLTSRG